MGAEATQPERGDSWDGIVRREIDVSIRVLNDNDEERSVEVVASSDALDSHGDVLRQFWDLRRYNANPVVLWNHNMFESSPYSFGGAVRPEDLMPIGTGSDVRIDGNRLVAKVTLLKATAEQEPLIDKLWRRVQQKVIRAVSVGFRPGQITRVLDESGNTDYFELGSAEHPNELREISFVPMGSNPEAVAKSIAFERKHLGRMAAEKTAKAERTEDMAMSAEEKAVYEKALADSRAADARVKALESDLDKERTKSTELKTELAAAQKRASDAEVKFAEGEVDKLVGVKLYPAEREKYVALAKKLGIDEVKDLVKDRPDIKLTDAPIVEGKKLADSQVSTAPEPAAGGDGSADIVKTATEGLN